MFDIHDISTVESDDLEQLGTKEKFWFVYTAFDQAKWLFKYSRAGTGEHWSEKIAEQICQLLSIPHVRYEIAKYQGRFGVISKKAVHDGERLVMGNELLYSEDQNHYPDPAINDNRHAVKEHTVARVMQYLQNAGLDMPEPQSVNLDAAGVFCGYLMLDVLIGNQDRHHENWAIIDDAIDGRRILCPSYDHAASLGRELLDQDRQQRLITKDRNQSIRYFVTKARSALFESPIDRKALPTMQAFMLATQERPEIRRFWLEKLKQVQQLDFEKILNKIDVVAMSDVSKEFALQMLLENRKRLLEVENG